MFPSISMIFKNKIESMDINANIGATWVKNKSLRFQQRFLTLFFPMFPFDLPENIRKPNISYLLIRTPCVRISG